MVVLLGLLLATTVASVRSDTTELIAATETRLGGRMGVAALDTGNSKRVDYRAVERFPMYSTFKFLAVAAILKRIDENKDKLDRFVPYSAKDILEYAPLTKAHLRDGGMTLGALCAAAIEQSDNTAGNLLLETIGGPAGLTNFARGLGHPITRLDSREPELNSAVPGDKRDTTTPAAMLADMRQLLTGNTLSPLSRQQLERWLQGNEIGAAMIRAGLPTGWIVGDKTGRGANGATNDIAIVRPPDRAAIIIAIYVVGSSAPSDDRAAAIAEAARAIVELLSDRSR